MEEKKTTTTTKNRKVKQVIELEKIFRKKEYGQKSIK
jgi:hypothetical protein